MTVNPVYGSPQLPPHTTTTQAEAAAAAYLLSLTAGAAGGIGATGASASNPTNIAFQALADLAIIDSLLHNNANPSLTQAQQTALNNALNDLKNNCSGKAEPLNATITALLGDFNAPAQKGGNWSPIMSVNTQDPWHDELQGCKFEWDWRQPTGQTTQYNPTWASYGGLQQIWALFQSPSNFLDSLNYQTMPNLLLFLADAESDPTIGTAAFDTKIWSTPYGIGLKLSDLGPMMIATAFYQLDVNSGQGAAGYKQFAQDLQNFLNKLPSPTGMPAGYQAFYSNMQALTKTYPTTAPSPLPIFPPSSWETTFEGINYQDYWNLFGLSGPPTAFGQKEHLSGFLDLEGIVFKAFVNASSH
jgi:hypothetical protein